VRGDRSLSLNHEIGNKFFSKERKDKEKERRGEDENIVM